MIRCLDAVTAIGHGYAPKLRLSVVAVMRVGSTYVYKVTRLFAKPSMAKYMPDDDQESARGMRGRLQGGGQH
jgi:hypothetical protein